LVAGLDEPRVRAEVLALLGELGFGHISQHNLVPPGYLSIELAELRKILIELKELRTRALVEEVFDHDTEDIVTGD
jgi:hypothetical protein